jgi:hypothetical protein
MTSPAPSSTPQERYDAPIDSAVVGHVPGETRSDVTAFQQESTGRVETTRQSRLKAIKTLPPLSPLTYYRRNVTRTLPVGGAIIISVFLIAAIVTLLNSVDDSITTNYGFVRHFSVLATQVARNVSPRLLDRVRKEPDLGQMISSVPYFLALRTVFGEMPVPVYGVEPDAMPVLAHVTGNRLVKGRWPRPNTPEIVMSRAWANNFSKDIGGWIGPKKDDNLPSIPDKQQLVGILEGGASIALTDRSYLLLELPDAIIRTSYLLVPKSPQQLPRLNSRVDDYLNNYKKYGIAEQDARFVRLYTFNGLVKRLRESLGFLYTFLAIADILVIGAVALMSGFLANIYFEQRLGEFGLLSALGFRRERLARRVIVETGMLVIAGWLLGLLLTWLIFRALDAYYMTPRGLVLAQLDNLAIRYTLPTPIIVGLASLGTVLFRLYRMDPIEIMERR